MFAFFTISDHFSVSDLIVRAKSSGRLPTGMRPSSPNFSMLNDIGELGAQPANGMNDGCRASCVDWYGNARPLFLKGRVFALLGYEIVEGKIANDGIKEIRRVTFAPRY